MADDLSSNNIEWKKKSIDKNERITLKTNIQEANLYQALKRNNSSATSKEALSSLAAQVPHGLKKIRRKIKDVFDEEDEDENSLLVPDLSLELLNANTNYASNSTNSLAKSLNGDEKKQLNIHEQVTQNAKITQANRDVLAMGLKNLSAKAIGSAVQKNAIGSNLRDEVIRQELRSQKKLNLSGVSDKDFSKALNGIRKIQSVSAQKDLINMDLKKVIEIGDKNHSDQEVAEIILEKTGRKEGSLKLKPANKSKIKDLDRQYTR